MYHVYFIQSTRNNKIYVGYTEKEPKQRLDEHNNGSNNWSKHNKPFSLIYYEKYLCAKDARQREKFYKTGFGKQIKYIIVEQMKKITVT